jgi:DNA gyrase subunit A
VTDAGMVIRCPVGGIRIARRRSQGVVVFKVGDGERVVSVARLPDASEDSSEENGEAAETPGRGEGGEEGGQDERGH